MPSSAWKMTLAADKPITVVLRDGFMAATLHAERFETGDARREAADVTVRTSLLEHRFLEAHTAERLDRIDVDASQLDGGEAHGGE